VVLGCNPEVFRESLKISEDDKSDRDLMVYAGVNEEIKAKAERTARDAEKHANKMSRKAAKTAAKAETAARKAEATGVSQPTASQSATRGEKMQKKQIKTIAK